MANASYGYGGTITAAQWAIMQPGMGVGYMVQAAGDLKVSPSATGVTIAAGSAAGAGVFDVRDAGSLTLSAPSSGTSWWAIVLRRVWGTTKATSYVALSQGTTQPSTISGRSTTPGTQDDQPLALVSWTAGQAQPVVAKDLRIVGANSETQTAYDAMVLTFSRWAGKSIRINGTTWRCWPDSSGSLAWVSDGSEGARATRSTTGPAISTKSTWVRVIFPDVAYGSMIDPTTGVITIASSRKHCIKVTFPWSSYGSAYRRRLAIFKGVAATGTPLACVESHHDGRWGAQVFAEDAFNAGDQVTVWIWSDVTSSGANPTEANMPLTSVTVSAV